MNLGFTTQPLTGVSGDVKSHTQGREVAGPADCGLGPSDRALSVVGVMEHWGVEVGVRGVRTDPLHTAEQGEPGHRAPLGFENGTWRPTVTWVGGSALCPRSGRGTGCATQPRSLPERPPVRGPFEGVLQCALSVCADRSH